LNIYERGDVVKILIKVFLEIANVCVNNRLVFALFKYFKVFDAVFVMYPAGYEFADHFTFRVRQKLIEWDPFIVGMIKHPSGKRTLMFAISAFIDEKDGMYEAEMLRMLHDRVCTLQKRLGATTTHFAGTLPSRFSALRIRRGDNQKNERMATQKNVTRAVMMLRKKLGHMNCNQVVVIGANGYIGKGVTEDLRNEGITVLAVDKKNPSENNVYEKPSSPHIVLNIATPEAINGYVTPLHMGEGTTLLNEVYPSPPEDIVRQMRELGSKVVHIAGLTADTFPKFPSSYSKAVPCCAGIPGEEYEVVLVDL